VILDVALLGALHMVIDRLLGPVRRLARDETGLATLEWVAIAAAVIILGIGVIIILEPKINSAASTVGSNLLSQVGSNS
jgi:Flp pilus assembly pilin Flp